MSKLIHWLAVTGLLLAVTGLISGEAVWPHHQSKFASDADRFNVWFNRPADWLTQQIHKLSFMRGRGLVLKGRSVYDTANQDEADFSTQSPGVCIRCLMNIHHQRSNIKLLWYWVMRKEYVSRESSMPISLAPLLSASASSLQPKWVKRGRRAKRDEVRPKEDFQGNALSDIVQRVFYGEYCCWSISADQIKGQWLKYARLHLYPRALTNNKSIAGGICSALRGNGGLLQFGVLPDDLSELTPHHDELAVINPSNHYPDDHGESLKNYFPKWRLVGLAIMSFSLTLYGWWHLRNQIRIVWGFCCWCTGVALWVYTVNAWIVHI